MNFQAALALGLPLGIGIAAIGSGIGLGLIGQGAMQGIARQRRSDSGSPEPPASPRAATRFLLRSAHGPH